MASPKFLCERKAQNSGASAENAGFCALSLRNASPARPRPSSPRSSRAAERKVSRALLKRHEVGSQGCDAHPLQRPERLNPTKSAPLSARRQDRPPAPPLAAAQGIPLSGEPAKETALVVQRCPARPLAAVQ
nr:uncharacterized protein LOC123280119 [Equus asinus]